MNRFLLLLSQFAFSAILLFLVSSSTVFAQVNYTLTATLALQSGPDLMGLNGLTVSATAILSQTTPPSNSTTTATSSTNTYTEVSGVALDGVICDTSSPVTVTLTDNLGAPDTIAVSNCAIQSALVSANAMIPTGYMSTAVPSNIPFANNVTGTVTYTLNGGTPSVFSLTDASIIAIGTPPPVVTASPASWTPPAVAAGSTTPLSQQILFTTSPVLPGGVVSFATSATTTPSGGTWLSVTPTYSNSSSSITITANPAGLSGGSYSGTVTIELRRERDDDNSRHPHDFRRLFVYVAYRSGLHDLQLYGGPDGSSLPDIEHWIVAGGFQQRERGRHFGEHLAERVPGERHDTGEFYRFS
jgi:hypothetical protein